GSRASSRARRRLGRLRALQFLAYAFKDPGLNVQQMIGHRAELLIQVSGQSDCLLGQVQELLWLRPSGRRLEQPGRLLLIRRDFDTEDPKHPPGWIQGT